MGEIYRAKCKKCGFKHEYFTGGGMLSKKYYDETRRLENKLKEEVSSGEYGPALKAMLDADTEGALHFSCGTDMFQCRECGALLVHRKKHIYLHGLSQAQYKLDIDIDQCCPECGSRKFERLGYRRPLCPNCKEESLELISIGLWD